METSTASVEQSWSLLTKIVMKKGVGRRVEQSESKESQRAKNVEEKKNRYEQQRIKENVRDMNNACTELSTKLKSS